MHDPFYALETDTNSAQLTLRFILSTEYLSKRQLIQLNTYIIIS